LRQAAEDALLAKEVTPVPSGKGERLPFRDDGPLAVVVGPTASGKTELALALARALDGEVVSADSRQVYRELCAGTAKPRRDRQGRVEGIPYHLVDCVPVTEPFDAGRFAALARARIAEIRSRGRVPIVAGGTGLYIRALLEGLCELPPRDEALRRRLAEEARVQGRARLHARLRQVDPEAAAAMPANNIQRVVRALEVYELTGRPISELWSEHKNEPSGGQITPSAILRIDWPPEVLRQRITARAGLMWPLMLKEVAELLSRFTGEEPGFQSLGYPEAVACVHGQLSLAEGLRRLISGTCAYARRQRTWFRHQVAAAALAGGRPEDMLAGALSLIPDHYASTDQ
jgi:tRNA dimethylallyltransferase